MKIVIETIPHAQQRYPTCGDWYTDDSGLHIKVSEEMGDPKFDLPSFVSISGPSMSAGFLGVQNGPFVVQTPGQPVQNIAYAQNVNAGRFEARQQAHYTFPEPVALYVTYRTVTVGSDGAPLFRDDVYGRDRRVVREMAKPRS